MSRKIYFAGSIRGGRQDQALYQQIISMLKANYGTVLTEHVGFPDALDTGILTDKEIHEKDMAWLQESSCLVAEVTQTSLGVGYEIGRAISWGKPILCLYRPQEGSRLSAMLTGADDGKNLTVKNYTTIEEVPEILKEFFAKLSS